MRQHDDLARRALPALALLGLTLAGCGGETAETTTTDGGAGASPEILAADADREAAPTTYKARRVWEAQRGLRFTDDGVELDEPVAAERRAAITAASAAEAMAAGWSALQEAGDPVAAIAAMRDAVLLAPESAEAYDALGRVLLAKRNDADALRAFRTAARLAPDSAPIQHHLGDALRRVGDRPAAAQAFRRSIELDPTAGDVHRRLAVELYYLGRIDESRATLDEAKRRGATIPAQFEDLLDGPPPAPAAQGAGPAPAPPTIGGQVLVDSFDGLQNETSAAASDAMPNVVISGWNDYRDQIRSRFALTTDGGGSWTSFDVRPPGPFQSSVEGDPMTAADDRDGTLWAGAISFGSNGGIYVARLEPGATSFEPSVMARVAAGTDKGLMAAGPDPSDPGNPNLTKLYVAYNEGLITSDDRGDTWTNPVNPGLFGIGYLPRVDSDGTLYVLSWDFNDRIELQRSDDGGATLTPKEVIATRMDVWGVDGTRFPGSFRVPPLAYYALDTTDGPNASNQYLVYFDTTAVVAGNSLVDLYFARSEDDGDTWSTPERITTATFFQSDAFFPWLEVDAAGRLHLLWYDTRRVASQDDGASTAFVDAYYAYSDDAGETWDETPLTPATFSTAGVTFIGDYLGMAIGADRLYPQYVSTQDGSTDVYTNVIVTPLDGDDDCPGDATGDGLVDINDLNAVLSNFDSTVTPGENGDVTGDGMVDINDLNEVLSNFNTVC